MLFKKKSKKNNPKKKIQKEKKKLFYGRTNRRTTQNYSSEPHKNSFKNVSSLKVSIYCEIVSAKAKLG